MNRQTTSETVRFLAGLGFAAAGAVAEELTASADPRLAAAALERLLLARGQTSGGASSTEDELLTELDTSPGLRRRLLAVLGGSEALGDHLVSQASRGKDDWRVLTGDGPPLPDHVDLLSDPATFRDDYRRNLLFVAGQDLAGEQPVDWVFEQLTDLADATLTRALAHSAGPSDPAELAVFALGKCGGRELNYVSDVDVLFVAPDPGTAATTQARELMRSCREAAWEVDAGLRPEGRSGPLVRTVDSYRAYYDRWAENWEFQALLKARFVTACGEPAESGGDESGGIESGGMASGSIAAEWAERIAPLIWTAAGRPAFVEQAQAMRQRVERRVNGDAREVKLGPGGLRDIEFATQLLQLVHGRTDTELRSASTIPALEALTAGGYVGRADGAALVDSYRFLRTVEHRLQLRQLRRTHRLPDDEQRLRQLARSLGYHRRHRAESAPGPGEPLTGSVVERFLADWRRHASGVRRLHEKLFYRPLLSAVARVPGDELVLGEAAAAERLAALGFADPAGVLRHVAALSSGVTRRAAIHRALLPVILKELADSADPDRGLLAYRRVSELLGRSPWFLRALRDGDVLTPRVARVLGGSRYVADLLERDAQGLAMLANDNDLAPRGRDEVMSLFQAAAGRAYDKVEVADRRSARALYEIRRHELLRIAAADMCGLLDLSSVGSALTDVMDAAIAGALTMATAEVARAHGGELPIKLAVIAMGRLGGRELSYGSDADVVLVHDPAAGVDAATAVAVAQAVAERLNAILAASVPDPPLKLDLGLRPEGRGGPLVPSLKAYRRYYDSRAGLWEIQALLRARLVTGDAELGETFMAFVDGMRYPAAGLAPEQVREILRMKARVETERLPRGADPATHLKLGRGGLVDVEWAAQLLQLRYAATHPELRTTSTRTALAAAHAAGVLAGPDRDELVTAWSLAMRLRNAIMLVRGVASDQLPRAGRDLAGVTRLVGVTRAGLEEIPQGAGRSGAAARNLVAGEFVDNYLRVMRKSRRAAERVFSV